MENPSLAMESDVQKRHIWCHQVEEAEGPGGPTVATTPAGTEDAPRVLQCWDQGPCWPAGLSWPPRELGNGGGPGHRPLINVPLSRALPSGDSIILGKHAGWETLDTKPSGVLKKGSPQPVIQTGLLEKAGSWCCLCSGLAPSCLAGEIPPGEQAQILLIHLLCAFITLKVAGGLFLGGGSLGAGEEQGKQNRELT